MTRTNWMWLLCLIAALGFATAGCTTATDDDDDSADDDDAGDDDSMPAEDCWTQVLSPSGDDGTYTFDPTVDHHMKHNFTMQEDIVHMIATMTWTEDRGDWQFGVDVGEGTCPHSGTTWLGDFGNEGEIVVDVRASDLAGSPDTFPVGANVFNHIQLINETDHTTGDSVGYDLVVEVCALQ